MQHFPKYGNRAGFGWCAFSVAFSQMTPVRGVQHRHHQSRSFRRLSSGGERCQVSGPCILRCCKQLLSRPSCRLQKHWIIPSLCFWLISHDCPNVFLPFALRNLLRHSPAASLPAVRCPACGPGSRTRGSPGRSAGTRAGCPRCAKRSGCRPFSRQQQLRRRWPADRTGPDAPLPRPASGCG